MGAAVEGDVNSGQTDTGTAPVKIGGVANASIPAGVTNGQRVQGWYSQNGAMIVGGIGSVGADGRAFGMYLSDGAGNADRPLVTAVFNGATYDRPRTPSTFKTIAAVAVTAGTPVTVWTPGAGKKFRLMGFMLSLSVAGSVLLKDAGTEILRTPLMAAGVGLASPPMVNGILSAVANNVLQVDASASGSVSGFVFGTEE
jgi:hypothetical protein